MHKKLDFDHIYKYHAPTVGQPEKYTQIRGKAKELALLLDDVCQAFTLHTH